MELTLLDRLYRHMEWADASTWRTVLSDGAASGDGYILDSLVHLHLVQRAHLAVWTAEEVVMRQRDDFGGPVAIRDWGRSYHAQATDFLHRLTEARLAKVVTLPPDWEALIESEIGGPPAPASLGDLMLQIPAHSIHHRAQISRRIREVGLEPGWVDYIGWVWQGEPPADWGEAHDEES